MQLGAPVRVGGAGGVCFVQRQVLRFAIHRSAGAEHQFVDAALLHGLQQADGALHIVGVIGNRLLNRLAYGLEAGKMDDGIGLKITQGLCEQVCVANVALHEGCLFAGNVPDAINGMPLAVAEVIKQ